MFLTSAFRSGHDVFCGECLRASLFLSLPQQQIGTNTQIISRLAVSLMIHKGSRTVLFLLPVRLPHRNEHLLQWDVRSNHWFGPQWFENPGCQWLVTGQEALGPRKSGWSMCFFRWGRSLYGHLFWADVRGSEMGNRFNSGQGFVLTRSDYFCLRPSKGISDQVILPSAEQAENERLFKKTFSPYGERSIF